MTATVTHDPPPAASGRPGRPLIVTEDADLLDDLLRLCAAAGATPEVHHGVPEPRGNWEAAPLVWSATTQHAACAAPDADAEWYSSAGTRTIPGSGAGPSRSVPITS